MSGILLLNADFTPLRVVSLQRGIGLIVGGKADVVEESEDPLRAARMSMKTPTVIRLKNWVQIPYRARIPLNRKALVARDRGKCAYCDKQGHTIDHIIPRSKGGQHTWENVVLACGKCNQKKADKTLDELGWSLKFTPKPPKTVVWFYSGSNELLQETWDKYLPV